MHRWPMWLGLLSGLAATAVGFSFFETLEDQWSAATRYTARVGFPLLILAYVARPLNDLLRSDWTRKLLKQRKWLGLGFAMSHTVHLLAIVMLYRTLGLVPDAITIIGGGGAYLTMYAMALTSNRTAMKALGKRWSYLHWIGIHYLWVVFFQSYFGRIFEQGYQAEGIIFSVIAIAAAGVRFVAWRRKRKTAKN
ncbi:hypothetical protein ACRAQ7_13445 [Erythrobacter sp. W53]|uniref:hypothetical protein n=1 Tax=Erythrobacter sp. W53 TaxID=3425947 RepID=UPI003D766846